MTSAELIHRWRQRSREASLAHYDSAHLCERNHFFLGMPTVVLSTIVGTSIFATLAKEAAPEGKIIIGTLSVLAATFAALQTFLRFAERAERHRVAAAQFSSLNKELELIQAYPQASSQEENKLLSEFRKRWDDVIAHSPTCNQRALNRRRAESTPFTQDESAERGGA